MKSAHHAVDLPNALRDLRGKYVEMLSMRLEHASGREDGARERARMAALASRFPGALREIDELELDVIRARIAELDAVLCGDETSAEWMHAIAAFHASMRGALFAKRWLEGRKTVDPALVERYTREAAAFEFATDALAWSEELHRVASPPGGRLLDLVFARVAVHLGTTRAHARTLVFRPRRAGQRTTPGRAD